MMTCAMANRAISTVEWASSFGISTAPTPPLGARPLSKRPRRARTVAARAIVLHCVTAVAAGAGREPIIDWLRQQGLWRSTSRSERRFLTDVEPSASKCIQLTWRAETEWTLLWALGWVDHLGLPTRLCDSRRMVDEIMPALGSDTTSFQQSAHLRASNVLCAEDERTYDLWCRAQPARRADRLPQDLQWGVLYERRYAFEWLLWGELWDEVTCDA